MRSIDRNWMWRNMIPGEEVQGARRNFQKCSLPQGTGCGKKSKKLQKFCKMSAKNGNCKRNEYDSGKRSPKSSKNFPKMWSTNENGICRNMDSGRNSPKGTKKFSKMPSISGNRKWKNMILEEVQEVRKNVLYRQELALEEYDSGRRGSKSSENLQKCRLPMETGRGKKSKNLQKFCKMSLQIGTGCGRSMIQGKEVQEAQKIS